MQQWLRLPGPVAVECIYRHLQPLGSLLQLMKDHQPPQQQPRLSMALCCPFDLLPRRQSLLLLPPRPLCRGPLAVSEALSSSFGALSGSKPPDKLSQRGHRGGGHCCSLLKALHPWFQADGNPPRRGYIRPEAMERIWQQMVCPARISCDLTIDRGGQYNENTRNKKREKT